MSGAMTETGALTDGASPESKVQLSPGDRLGPYEIVGFLAKGGMGQVYRAHDPRLRRNVAIKILDPSLSLSPEYIERLGREARAAGGLNHPNILAVFDVGTEGPLPYVVSELLEGESLRERLQRAALPYRKVIEYAIQLAQALGAAHEKGLVHRDVKPGNIFITSDGRIKLLDFGLVKVRPREHRVGSEDPTVDVPEGGIHGTVGYMSPEQVLGETLDHRSDLFAFGIVLFEMFTRTRAFLRDSTIQTMKAVLNDEPADLLDRKGTVPPAAAAVVRRCLEKSKEERFQSARDLAFHLQQLGQGAPPLPPEPWLRRALLPSVLALGLVPAVYFIVRKIFPPPAPPAFEQLTFRNGRIGGARFASPDGAVVYSESREGGPPEVWQLPGGSGNRQSSQLGQRGSDILAVHQGHLALCLRRRSYIGDRYACTLAEAQIGESPHEIAENVEGADWDPPGDRLAIVHWAGDSVGAGSNLEYPPGTVLFKTTGSLRSPRFSPDGRRIAFLEDTTGRAAGGKVSVVDLEGKVTVLTDNYISAQGLAWSADGREIWFAAGPSRTERSLRAVGLDKGERLILQTPASMTLRDVAADGSVLITRDEERTILMGVPPGESAERDLSWFDTTGLADVSDDGKVLLFSDRSGIYVRRLDPPAAPTHLGLREGFADDLSPDGTKVLATTVTGDQIFVLPAGPGNPVPMPAHGISSHRGALWFPDGRRIIFNGTEPSSGTRSYVQDLDGTPPRPFTSPNTWVTSISPDGKSGAGVAPHEMLIWPMDGGPPRVLSSAAPEERPVAWSANGRSVWTFSRSQVPASVFELDVQTGARRLWKTLRPPDLSGVSSIDQFKVTPDGRSYFYSYRRVLSQLYTVRGLK